MGLELAKIDVVGNFGIAATFEIGKPVSRGLVCIAVRGVCCDGRPASLGYIGSVEVRRAVPKRDFIDLRVLLGCLQCQRDTTTNLLDELRRKFNDRIIAVSVVFRVGTVDHEDQLHERAPDKKWIQRGSRAGSRPCAAQRTITTSVIRRGAADVTARLGAVRRAVALVDAPVAIGA